MIDLNVDGSAPYPKNDFLISQPILNKIDGDISAKSSEILSKDELKNSSKKRWILKQPICFGSHFFSDNLDLLNRSNKTPKNVLSISRSLKTVNDSTSNEKPALGIVHSIPAVEPASLSQSNLQEIKPPLSRNSVEYKKACIAIASILDRFHEIMNGKELVLDQRGELISKNKKSFFEFFFGWVHRSKNDRAIIQKLSIDIDEALTACIQIQDLRKLQNLSVIYRSVLGSRWLIRAIGCDKDLSKKFVVDIEAQISKAYADISNARIRSYLDDLRNSETIQFALDEEASEQMLMQANQLFQDAAYEGWGLAPSGSGLIFEGIDMPQDQADLQAFKNEVIQPIQNRLKSGRPF
ncbi:MAG: hypothetical protein QRY74_02605 [Chlamydia sp.]